MVGTRRKNYTPNEDSIRGVAYERALKALNRLPSPKTRKEREKVAALKIVVNRRKFKIPRTPPIIQDERATRSTYPSCLYFGMEKQFKIRFPNYLFCSHCRAWEAFKKNPSNLHCKRSSDNFACRAHHRSWVHPSTKIKPHHSLFTNIKIQKRNATTAIDNEYQDSDDDNTNNLPNMEYLEYPLNSTFRFPSKRKRSFIPIKEIEEKYVQIETHNQVVQDLREQIIVLEKENSDLLTKLSSAYQRNYRGMSAQRKYQVASTKQIDTTDDTNEPSDTIRRIKSKTKTKKLDVEKVLMKKIQEFKELTIISQKDINVSKHKRIVNAICDVFFSSEFLEGDIYKECFQRIRKYFREEIFSPWKVLRAMDLAGGGLCYMGIEILRECETGGRKYFRGSILPCSAELKRHARFIERFASDQGLTFEHGLLEGSTGIEFVEFDVNNTVKFTVKAFGLEEIAKHRSIQLATSIDAAQASKRQIHTTMGLKVQDIAAICPSTKQHLFANLQTEKSLLQSRNCCIPLKIILTPETKDIYQHFKDIFQKFNNEDSLLETGGEHASSSILGPTFKPIRSPTTCDLSAKWKGLCRGGAMKISTYACECCAIRKENIAKPNPVRCNKWCRHYALHHSDETQHFACHHHDILTEDRMKLMEDEAEELKEMIHKFCSSLESVRSQSYIDVSENPLTPTVEGVSSRENPKSIHYNLQSTSRTRVEIAHYARGITKDLILRNLVLPPGSSLVEKREILHNSLKQEYTFLELQENLRVGRLGSDDALFVLMNTIPCILHMENRVGIKILTVLLNKGLSNARHGRLYSSQGASTSEENQIDETSGSRTTEKQRAKRFVDSIEESINTEIFGTKQSRAQWSLPYDSKKMMIDDITMDNTRTRLVIRNMDIIIKLCFHVLKDEDIMMTWYECLRNYRNALLIMRSRTELTDREIHEFQFNIDKWYHDWLPLSGGQEGITNYIHMLSSGHVAEYMFKWRNLWIHSQQGWEALNAMIKTFFLRRTGRGGSHAKVHEIQRSRLLPLGRWFQRRLIWMTGHTMQDITEYYDSIESPVEDSLDLVERDGEDEILNRLIGIHDNDSVEMKDIHDD